MIISGKRTWMFACLAGLFLALATFVIFDREAGLLQVRELKHQHSALTSEARTLEARRDFLTERLALLEQGDAHTLEEVAREKNLIHPGDVVYRIHFSPDADVKATR